ncbi:MAG TPA: 3-hydroxyacyl-CoA dehydrogenase family protein, partial [Phnomibacter sp.]|nr:3-hydroxyacyl-CoA dehydrogenase family protein [Phnomibacter sp.]
TFGQMNVAHKLFARFCGWPGFMLREKWEVAVCQQGPWLESFSQLLNKQLVPVADAPGLVAPRILAMIFNEACYGLADGICSASDMDTAMKLGTNYPKGPVAWMEEIGKEKIAKLLSAMAKTDNRYAPHPLLTES